MRAGRHPQGQSQYGDGARLGAPVKRQNGSTQMKQGILGGQRRMKEVPAF
jgi:hypothetical protein